MLLSVRPLSRCSDFVYHELSFSPSAARRTNAQGFSLCDSMPAYAVIDSCLSNRWYSSALHLQRRKPLQGLPRLRSRYLYHFSARRAGGGGLARHELQDSWTLNRQHCGDFHQSNRRANKRARTCHLVVSVHSTRRRHVECCSRSTDTGTTRIRISSRALGLPASVAVRRNCVDCLIHSHALQRKHFHVASCFHFSNCHFSNFVNFYPSDEQRTERGSNFDKRCCSSGCVDGSRRSLNKWGGAPLQRASSPECDPRRLYLFLVYVTRCRCAAHQGTQTVLRSAMCIISQYFPSWGQHRGLPTHRLSRSRHRSRPRKARGRRLETFASQFHRGIHRLSQFRCRFHPRRAQDRSRGRYACQLHSPPLVGRGSAPG
ncbi:hypothetical protein C8R47DRAFT_129669 [Mycena vitilis]|nr:hypothetical protein C8R47DRAFT_129669 [Mycena vitilis]